MELFLQELAGCDRFYLAFVAADRWKLYLSGLGNTLAITLGAICISTVLGNALCLMKISRTGFCAAPPRRTSTPSAASLWWCSSWFIYFVVLVT